MKVNGVALLKMLFLTGKLLTEIEYYRNQKMKHAVVMGLSNFMLLALTLDVKVVRALRA